MSTSPSTRVLGERVEGEAAGADESEAGGATSSASGGAAAMTCLSDSTLALTLDLLSGWSAGGEAPSTNRRATVPDGDGVRRAATLPPATSAPSAGTAGGRTPARRAALAVSLSRSVVRARPVSLGKDDGGREHIVTRSEELAQTGGEAVPDQEAAAGRASGRTLLVGRRAEPAGGVRGRPFRRSCGGVTTVRRDAGVLQMMRGSVGAAGAARASRVDGVSATAKSAVVVSTASSAAPASGLATQCE